MPRTLLLLSLGLTFVIGGPLQAAEPKSSGGFRVRKFADRLEIALDGRPIAEYVFDDAQVRRPYLCRLRTPSGVQVTRNHPPTKGRDLDDHPTIHPGVWLAFGDLSGTDFWRNKGLVRHGEFKDEPTSRDDRLTFTAQNRYEAGDRTIADETCGIEFVRRPDGYLIVWQSTFQAGDDELVFGDQEEMGLGIRVATPLAVASGGEIIDAAGRRNGKEVWGTQSPWCRYGGTLDGRQVGLVLMPGPKNFSPAWFHARDYGLLVANPFGRRAFTKKEPSRVVVQPGETLVLRFGIRVYDLPAGAKFDAAAAYREDSATLSP